jgi:glycosyltransferase involved in cell wall biosynthesis
MNPKPHVTVLTAVRNGARYIAETIESVQKQTFADWEYIIVDDASTDETLRVLERHQRQDARLRVLKRITSAGPYTAANDGLREARGEYVVRIDADDLATPDRIARQLAFLAAHPEYRACVSYWQGLNESGIIPGTVTPVPESPRVFCWALLLRSASIHSAVCYERSMMQELGGYRDLLLSQDYRLWCDLTRRGWLGIMPEVLCYVRSHPKRESHSNFDVQRQLALDVLADHLFALTGERWSREDLTALRSVGHSEGMPADKGIEMLDRWDRLWKAATDLTPEDRRELARLSAFRRWKHLRANARTQPFAVLFGLLKLVTTKSQFLVPALRGIGS